MPPQDVGGEVSVLIAGGNAKGEAYSGPEPVRQAKGVPVQGLGAHLG